MLQENVSALHNYEDLSKDGGVLKKIITQGFSKFSPVDGEEAKVHYISYLEDGRNVDNTRITNTPQSLILGNRSIIPGLEIALKKMKMGEHAKVTIKQEYSFAALDKEKTDSNSDAKTELNPSLDSSNKTSVSPKTSEEIFKMEIKEAKLYSTITYELELIKYDKQRKNKIMMEPDERVSEASNLKNEGNELFKENRFMEAIIKYNDAWEYLTQLPNEFISNRIFELRLQIKLNIVNCHLSLHEYNYALKKLNEIFSMKNPQSPKFFYYRAIALMNQGEFEKAEVDLNYLIRIMPNDSIVKNLKEDLVRLKEKTLKANKNLIKKGIFNNNLYEEKILKTENKFLPKFDVNNLSFYLDLIVNNDSKTPQKLKFEIFSLSDFEDYKKIVNLIKELVKYKKFVNSNRKNKDEISITNERKTNLKKIEINNKTHPILELINFSESEEFELFKNLFEKKNLNKIHNPPCEEIILFVYKENLKSDSNLDYEWKEKISLNFSFQKISDEVIPNIFPIGRCFYKTPSFLKNSYLNDSESFENFDITILDCDFSHFV